MTAEMSASPEPRINVPRGTMPKLSEISRHWERLGEEALAEVFPALRCFEIGWGEPFCFRCGWLVPTREAGHYPKSWRDERAIDAAWDAASGWLERAHVHDHLWGGDESADNLVPLCVICHDEAPSCKSREAGIEFVKSGPTLSARHIILIRLYTDHCYNKRSKPGPSEARRLMLRARSVAAEAMLERMESA